MSNLIGRSLGRYHILEQLGEGGMAVVYKAFDTRLERQVAIKVILPTKEHSGKFLKRFEREAKSLAQLSHPNIVKVIDYGEHEGLPYLVMEYLPGGTLKSKLSGKPLPWQEAARLLVPIARALAYAHEHKIIHRDIKPSNILVTESGEPMLSDFGIAKILEAEETLDLTGTGVGIGTPEYMSPEQAQGRQIDGRADIYSLGVVFYEMITGRKLYQADTPYAVVIKHVNDPLPRPMEFVKDLPTEVERALLKALAKNPQDRYEDMQAMVQSIHKLEVMNDSIPGSRGDRKKIAWLVPGILFALAVALMSSIWFGLLRPNSPQSLTNITTEDAGIVPTAISPISSHAPQSTNPEGTYLVFEDFEDGQIQMYGFSAQPGWQVIDDGTGNKVFEVDNRQGKEYPSFSFGADEWTNYIVEYQVRYLSEKGSVGLQVRSDGTNSYVEDLSIGELYLAYATPSEWTRISTAFPPIESQRWYTVRVTVEGDSIQVFVDNNRWIDEVDSRSQNGWLLMFASPGTYAQVDNLRVWDTSNEDTTGRGDILLDQSHEGLTVSLETAATMTPDHPEFVYIGQFYEGNSEGYDVSLHETQPIDQDVLSGYRVLILTAPNGLYFDQEFTAILDFVERGGGLLVLYVDGAGNLNRILSPFGIQFEGRPLGSPDHLDWGPWGFHVSVDSTDPILNGVSSLTVNAGSAVKVDDPNKVILWTSPSVWIDSNENQQQDSNESSGKFPVVIRLNYGQGKVVILPAVEVWGGFYRENERIFLNALDWLMNN